MILSLNLSRPGTDLSLHDEAFRCVAERQVPRSYSHAEEVIPQIESLLAERDLKLQDLTRYVTCSGPGSFTGLRVAYATLKAFAFLTHRPIDCVDGTEARALAWAARHPKLSGELKVFSPLVPGRTVVARFLMRDGVLQKESEEIALLHAEETIELLAPVPIQETFALTARFLVEGLALAQSRVTYEGFDRLAEASPKYFGDSFA